MKKAYSYGFWFLLLLTLIRSNFITLLICTPVSIPVFFPETIRAIVVSRRFSKRKRAPYSEKLADTGSSPLRSSHFWLLLLRVRLVKSWYLVTESWETTVLWNAADVSRHRQWWAEITHCSSVISVCTRLRALLIYSVSVAGKHGNEGIECSPVLCEHRSQNEYSERVYETGNGNVEQRQKKSHVTTRAHNFGHNTLQRLA